MAAGNLYSALRAAFPADMDAVAVETADGPDAPAFFTWRDLDRASARIANLLTSLELPAASRIAVQTDKCVEALLLYLAVLRAGHVYLPLNNAYQAAEIEYFVGNAEPAVFVCTPKNFAWISKIAFRAGTKNVFTLGDDRSGTLLERAAGHAAEHAVVPREPGDLASDSTDARGSR
jgi:malonyl-CoA/methylmalonyl-CoA synthetase